MATKTTAEWTWERELNDRELQAMKRRQTWVEFCVELQAQYWLNNWRHLFPDSVIQNPIPPPEIMTPTDLARRLRIKEEAKKRLDLPEPPPSEPPEPPLPSVDPDVAEIIARVQADGGVVTDEIFLNDFIVDLKMAGVYTFFDVLYIPIVCKKDGGNRVSRLYDLSPVKAGGVYYDAVQNIAASQQLFQDSQIDGKPWVLFDPLRTGGYLSAPVVPYTGYPFTYFIVARAGSATDEQKAIFGRMTNSDRLDVLTYFSFNKIVFYVGVTALNLTTDITTVGQFTCLFNGASSTLRRKGVQVAVGDSGPISSMSNLQFSLGDYRTFWPLNGSIAFAAACCRSITTGQRDAIENLLNTKYYPSTIA